ncbi:MAG: (2Fe-2S)-binding protein [Candidatus Tectomicrobia bacterium]|nr:(2Fe-2S)-binding protein [Candidatus Tectomicrobia bacterium]
MEQLRPAELRVNGERRTVLIRDNALLLDVLRDQLDLLGMKEGCGVSACGTCTVLLDGRPISACLTLAAQIGPEEEILTIEGLARDGRPDPVQRAFYEESAFQCAFCTPGMIMAVKGLLLENPSPADEEIREYLLGNYCRCGAHLDILRAVRRAAEIMRQETA